jgi:hypothetical protein
MMRASILTALLSFCLIPACFAQEAETGADSRVPEAEFVGSTSFRSASYVQPLWKGLHFESDYFGTDENDVGYTGAGWEFRWKDLRLSPGFGVAFGGNAFHTMPAFSFRWDYEKKWFVTEGLVVQGLQDTAKFPSGPPEGEVSEGAETVRPTITDGDHVSVQWRRLTVGGTWERIQFREIEWKGGGRVAFRIIPQLSVVMYVLGPNAEVRGGLMFHPAKNE